MMRKLGLTERELRALTYACGSVLTGEPGSPEGWTEDDLLSAAQKLSEARLTTGELARTALLRIRMQGGKR